MNPANLKSIFIIICFIPIAIIGGTAICFAYFSPTYLAMKAYVNGDPMACMFFVAAQLSFFGISIIVVDKL